MLVNIRGKSLLSLKDFRQAEIEGLLALARELKAAKSGGKEIKYLEGKSIALIFEKNSTHTRIGFEVAAYDQGAHVTYLGPSGTQLGRKESMKDTARVLGRIYDGIEYRGYDQKKVTILADHAGVPVFNGLTDQYHPTQILADLLTMQEHVKRPLKDISFCYIGDARNNMGHSLLLGGAKMGMNVRICAPPECQPEHSYQSIAHAFALDSGASVLITDDPREAVVDCDFIYTDAWVSMGESEEVWQQRIELLKPYQVNHELLEISGNLDIKFMHCLPALHNTETELGQLIHQKYGLDSLEVTEEVFESSRSIVFDQAENRMHTIKAVLVASLYGDVSVKDEPLALNKF